MILKERVREGSHLVTCTTHLFQAHALDTVRHEWVHIEGGTCYEVHPALL